jgi:hypothetical protein
LPIFEIAADKLVTVEETSFGAEGIYERKHIQLLLRNHIKVLDERLMVIAEEFGDWLDSSRRIDLLCLDGEANLVVVELKRTDDGGHMELQALRYAAMISAMTFEQLVDTHARFRNKTEVDTDAAKAAILEFLGWDEALEDQFGLDTRIILAAADFGKELTTTVMWLNDRGLDIRCIRMKPYRLKDGTILLDVQQLVPLPEAATFQTQIGVKRQAERQSRKGRVSLREKWWSQLLEQPAATMHAHLKAGNYHYFEARWHPGIRLTYSLTETENGVEVYLGRNDPQANLAMFRRLQAKQELIDQTFGAPLVWDPMEGKKGCRIKFMYSGGYRSLEEEWPALHAQAAEAMRRLALAFEPHVGAAGANNEDDP